MPQDAGLFLYDYVHNIRELNKLVDLEGVRAPDAHAGAPLVLLQVPCHQNNRLRTCRCRIKATCLKPTLKTHQ